MAQLYKQPKSPFWWYTYQDRDGRRVRASTRTGDRRLAERILAEHITQADARRGKVDRSKIIWATFKQEYLHHSKAKPRKTYLREAAAIACLERYVHLVLLIDLQPKTIERLAADMKIAGLGVATINRTIGALRTMVKTAERWGYIDAQDWSGIKLHREGRNRPKFWTEKEVCEALVPTCGYAAFNGADTNWTTVVMLGVQAGLRRGEIYHVDREDLDTRRKALGIRPKPCSCPDCKRDGKWIPKDSDERLVFIPDELMSHLLKNAPEKGPLIGERPKSMDSMTTMFRKIVRRAGLVGSIHSLRHTYASWWIQHGGSLKALQLQLGHSDIKSTMVYAHLAPQHQQDEVRVIPRVLSMTKV